MARRKQKKKSNLGHKAGAALALIVLALLLRSGHSLSAHLKEGGARSASLSGTLDCGQLEELWEDAGGSASTAFLAAEVAMAESAGHQYATDLNGGRSTDRGYFQINSSHGSLSTYDPIGNAKAAVIISDDGLNWTPWVTFNTGLYKGQC